MTDDAQRLEGFPLAEVYEWRYPKKDTGGALFLYPPKKGKVRPHRHGKDVFFQSLHIERVESLNPDDVMGMKMRTEETDKLEPSFQGNGGR